MGETIALNAGAELDEVMDRVIFQDLLDCVRHLPENSIDLAILDPPYNLDKMFGITVTVH
jgi:site-specific DNA-methyltransferase (adenine-specific)